VLFKKGVIAEGTKWRLIGITGKLFLDFLFLFSSVERQGYSAVAPIIASRRFIFAFWHSRILLLCYLYKRLKAAIMVSNSADGEVIAQILKRHGHKTIRGSTHKGGLKALRQQIREMRTCTRPGVVIPDGPQGPRHKVQIGVILLAQKTGCPIIPIAYSVKRCKIFNSWDRFMLPMPWTKGIVTYGRPIWVPMNADAVALNQCANQLEQELNRITAMADNYYNHRCDK
jgi:lysophospholipid acyltransferase (LPLAT)-like uncharacterized protein